MKWTSAVFGLTLIALPAQTLAAATAETCLTRTEAKGLALFILPDMIKALRDKCRATLPLDAYLKSGDSSERFRADAQARWPLARKAFGKIAGGDTLLDMIGEDGSRRLLTGSITDGITKDVKPKSCPGVDRMLAALAPLPVGNVEMLLDSFFVLGLGSDEKGKTGNFRICPEPASQGTAAPASIGTKP